MPESASDILTVSQITSRIKDLLEGGFAQLTVEGEISGFKPPLGLGSRHLYFNIKDERALLKVVFFGGASKPLGFDLRDGQKVRISGRISVYEPSGNYQLVVSQIVQAGIGDILARVEELKQRLTLEGLFDPKRKKPLPVFPERIVIITSATGAALRDMLRILQQNDCPATIRVLPALVQGTEAPAQLAARLRQANHWHLGDLIILGRGGGSFEDLLAFSDETLVRAVAASRIPVISAVGHEVDTPLCDFAADLRAPTPTAAAEIASQAWSGLGEGVARLAQEMTLAVGRKLERARLLLAPFSRGQLEESFRRIIQPFYQRLDDAKEGLVYGIQDNMTGSRHRFELAFREMSARSPLDILSRGYAVVTDAEGKNVTDARTLHPGERLGLRFHTGRAEAEIKEILP